MAPASRSTRYQLLAKRARPFPLDWADSQAVRWQAVSVRVDTATRLTTRRAECACRSCRPAPSAEEWGVREQSATRSLPTADRSVTGRTSALATLERAIRVKTAGASERPTAEMIRCADHYWRRAIRALQDFSAATGASDCVMEATPMDCPAPIRTSAAMAHVLARVGRMKPGMPADWSES